MKPMGFRFLWRLGLGLGQLILLQGCEVGPDYHTPPAPAAKLTMPVQSGPGAQSFVQGADIEGDWWHLFQSKALDGMVRAGLANNPNLAAAQASLVEAEENLRAAGGMLVPSVAFSAQAERQQPAGSGLAAFGSSTGTRAIPPYTLYTSSLTVSYALDLWGEARRDIEGKEAQAEYQRDELEAAYLTLTGNIVTEAVQEAALRGQIEATNKVIADEARTLRILRAQQAAGGASGAQVLQQQAQLAQAQATLPPLQQAQAQAQNQLVAYEGGLPGGAAAPPITLGDLSLPPDVPVSLPSSIVAQRPDIRAAAAQLHEASANVGVATAQLLPQITLSAEIGRSSLTPGTLFSPTTLLWNLVAGLSQPVFQGGTLLAQRKSAIAALHVAGAQYQDTVVTAFQNVADALSALQYDQDELNEATAARMAAGQSLRLTQAQFQLGAEPLTAVLTAQTTYQQAVLAEVKAKAARLSDTAALYVTLGGGWWHRNDVAQTCCGVVP